MHRRFVNTLLISCLEALRYLTSLTYICTIWSCCRGFDGRGTTPEYLCSGSAGLLSPALEPILGRLALIMVQYCCIILFRISPKRMVLCSQILLSLCRKKFIIPNSDNFGASSSEVAVVAPPWLTSKSEDDEPLTHKIEVDV